MYKVYFYVSVGGIILPYNHYIMSLPCCLLMESRYIQVCVSLQRIPWNSQKEPMEVPILQIRKNPATQLWGILKAGTEDNRIETMFQTPTAQCDNEM